MSNVYLEAAELVNAERGIYASCIAIQRSGGSPSEYCNLFSPSQDSDNEMPWGTDWGDTRAERKACRVLALLLMHAITQYEEKHK